MSNNITISGNVASEPDYVNGDGYTRLSFALYDNERRKVKGSDNEYENTGNVIKLQVTLWNELADEFVGSFNKGDVVEITGSVTEREYTRNDGTVGRQLQTSFVNSLVVKFRKSERTTVPAETGGGFFPDDVPAGFQ
jgi:single-stranded DNA-binding protein